MRLLQPFALSTASTFAIAIAASPAAASQQNVAPVTVEECSVLETESEREACLERFRDVDDTTEGELATQPPVAQVEQASDGPTLVVTGSRLRRTPFNSPDPLTIIDPEQSLREGDIEVAEILQSTPVAAGSTQITSFLSSNFVTNGGPGAQTISLRGLGAERTLVLLNGRRAGPAGTRGAIASFDLNVLPSSIVQSVEIVKTGASSVYGSDAVAGVVNILTKRSTDGIELRAFTSQPFESGGETYDFSATYGQEFDRGYFLVSGSYFRRNELERGDRDYLGCSDDYIFNEAGERVDLIDPRTDEPVCNGLFGPVIALADFQFDIADAFGIPVPVDEDGEYTCFGDPALFRSNLCNFPGAPFAIGAIQYATPENRSAEFVQPLRDCTNFIQFCAPGNLVPINYDAISTGVTNYTVPFGDSVIPFTERYTAYATGGFEITPSLEVFAEFLYNKRITEIDGSRQLFPQQFTGSSVLPFLFGFSDDLFSGDPFNDEFSGEVILIPVTIIDYDQRQEVDYYRGVIGARGDFGGGIFAANLLEGWNWDFWGQYSRSEGVYEQDIVFQDAFDKFNLRTEACAGTVTEIRGVPCVDIDFTDPRVLNGDFTDQERAFLFGVDVGETLYEQLTFEAAINGELFNLPAGPVLAAFGAQWRRDEIFDSPGEATQAGNSWGLTSAGITAGSQTNKELFAEIEFPILRDEPIADSLTLSAAGRLTNVTATRLDGASFSTNGNFTFKLGANWQVNDWVRLRATYGTSFRAPALFEQFLDDQTSFLGQAQIDPCINYGLIEGQAQLKENCAADGVPPNYNAGGTSSALIITGGGFGLLEPETSRALTASFILTPPGELWEGARFSLAIDYFDIQVQGQIATLGAANILSACYTSEFFPDDPLCDLFDREMDPADPRDNEILTVQSAYLNIDEQNNRGIDLTVQFSQDMGDWGDLSILAQTTWQLEDVFALFEGTALNVNGEAGDPQFIGDFDVNWRKGPWRLFYNLTVIGGTSDEQDVRDANNGNICFNNAFRGTVCPDFRLEPTFYHDASISYSFMDDRFEVTLGVSNIFDTAPPRISRFGAEAGGVFGNVPINGSQYDYLGRRVFGGITAKF